MEFDIDNFKNNGTVTAAVICADNKELQNFINYVENKDFEVSNAIKKHFEKTKEKAALLSVRVGNENIVFQLAEVYLEKSLFFNLIYWKDFM